MNHRKYVLTIFFFCLLLPILARAAGPEILSGTVIFAETTDRYTIIQIKQDEKELWLAATAFDAAVGDKIEYMGGVPMGDFYVKALDRTFDEILFLSNIRKAVDEQKEPPPEETAQPAVMPDDDYHRNITTGQPVAAPAPGEVIKAAAELTIAEVFARRSELADQVVSVRGKVLKLTKNILGRTWVTLADGSGTAPDDKLLATTLQEVRIGETLSVTGTVKTNINLGAGYQYKAILEEATFAR